MADRDPADGTEDRRRLRRRMRRWRRIAIVAGVVAVALIVARAGALRPLGPHVARVEIVGPIGAEATHRAARIAALAEDNSVRAVILAVDSPGGTVGGGEILHAAVAHVAAVKPVAVVMRGTAASAAYMLSAPATRIFALGGTLTGSIGVILQTQEVGTLAGKIGIVTDTIVSGPLKDQPNLFHPTSPEGRKVLQDLVTDIYDQFVDIVATGRHLSPDAVRALADGRAYTGRQALGLHLVDAIGGETEAREWLAAEKGIPTTMPGRRVKIDPDSGTIAGLLGSAAGTFGQALGTILVEHGLAPDSAVSLWQPSVVSRLGASP